MEPKDQLADILMRMEHLLRRVKAYWHANYIEDTINILKYDESAALKRLVGVEFWGGSGSFVDYVINNENVSNDIREDNLAYQKLLLELIHYLSNFDYSKKRIKSLTKLVEALIHNYS